MRDQTIPVADLTDFLAGGARRERCVRIIGDALVDTGFFALCGHGIPSHLLENAYALAEQLFTLPDTAKSHYEHLELHGQRGYTSFGREHAKDASAPDLKEFWHVGQESADPSYVPNIWPSEIQEFKPVFLQLFRQLESCAMHLLEACALYIGEAQDRFSSIAAGGNTILRLIHYPPIPEHANPASIRAAAHEDINLITLLPEATASGLELLERSGVWRPIHALQGQIIVDAGDMLQNLTNGFYKSTTHRVVNPGDSRERRFSMPMFVHPRSEVCLAPLPSSIERTGGEACYPKITAGAYLAQRLHEIGLSAAKKSEGKTSPTARETPAAL